MKTRPTCSTCPNWMRQQADQGICVKDPAQVLAMPMQVEGYDSYHKRPVVQTQFVAVGHQPPMKAGMVCSHHPEYAEWQQHWTPEEAEPSEPPVNGKPHNRLVVPGQ